MKTVIFGERASRTLARRYALRRFGLTILATTALNSPALAASPTLPTGGQFVTGAGVIGAPSGGALNISQTTLRGVIDWKAFSIGQGGLVTINNGAGATLNRVTGGQLSRIDGTFTATGSLYFINPQGVVVGSTGQVLGGGSVVLSTRDIANAAFMGADGLAASGTSEGGIVNQGRIASDQGDVILLGRSIDNSGDILAAKGTVTLAAANSVLMAPVGGVGGVYVASDVSTSGDVSQSGRIQAAAAMLTAAGGNVFTLAGNRSGLINALGTTTIKGQVWLSAPNGTVSTSGAVTAVNADGVGGEIAVTGRSVAINSDASLSAQGSRGGQVLVGAATRGAALAQTATIADGAKILAGGPGGGGFIETSGHDLMLGAADIRAGQGGAWLTDPTDLTIGAAAATAIAGSLNAGTNVTEQTSATTVNDPSGLGVQSPGAGDITVTAPIVWTGTGSLNLIAFNTATINATISGGGGVTVVAGGDIALGAGGSVSAAADIKLAASGNFVNTAGAGAVSSSAGRWLILSTTPSANTLGGLTADFVQYAATASTSPAQAAGNGLLYSIAPKLTLSALKGAVTKVYDGLTEAPLTSANVTVSGLLGGDTATVAGVYAAADAGTGLSVTTTSVVETNGAAKVYGYALTSPSVTGDIGVITPAPITAVIIGNPTKVYDQTTTATLTSANYSLSGFISGGATVNQPSAVAYDSANAGARSVTATFTFTNFTATGGANLANYLLPATATGAGQITPAPLLVRGVLANSKVYDGATIATLNTASASLYGVLSGDTVTLSSAGATGLFAQKNVGNAIAVSATGFSISGASAANYGVTAPQGLAANITPASLTLVGVTASNKPYDGGVTAALVTPGSALTGVLPGDGVSLLTSNAKGAFYSADVGTGIPVAASGYALTGADATNYTLQAPGGLTANITPVTLTAAITATPTKVYDGSTSAYLGASGFTITGFVNGESATINQVAQFDFASPNAGTQGVLANLQPSDFLAVGGAKLTNYILPTSAAGTGLITPAPIMAVITGNPSKTYDATTSATLAAANFVLSGFLAGQGATVTQTTGTYASANAGAEPVQAVLTGFLTASAGTLLSNYSFPALASGVGSITAAPLIINVGPPYNINGAVVGNPTKVYDGTTTLTGLTSANFSLTGFQGADSATVTKTTGTFGSANAGVEPVTVSLDTNLVTGDFAAVGATNLANYVLPSAVYGSGTIVPATITAAITGNPTKVYNGATRAVVAGSDLTFMGFVGADSVTLPTPILGAYDSASAGARTVTASFTGANLTAVGSTLLSNYVLPGSASGAGLITQAPLFVVGVSANGKTYDTTTAAALNLTNTATFGLVSGDTVNLSTAGAMAVFASPNAGLAVPVTASGFTITGGAAANYQLIQPTGLAGDIAPKTLTVSGVLANDRLYDNSLTASFDTSAGALQGVFSSDLGLVDLNGAAATGLFQTKNVGVGLAVTAKGFGLSGAQAGNYLLTQPTGLTATISPAPITATIVGAPTKVYDATGSVTLTQANYTLSGFVPGSGDSATVPQSASATYGSPNAGVNVPISSTLVLSDFVAGPGVNLSNYALPTTGTGFGVITPAPITGRIIGRPTKTYDTTANATLTAANYALSGFVGADGVTVGRSSGTYASANAGARAVSVSGLSGADYAGTGATLLSNYSLPTDLTGPGQINRAPLTIVNVFATDKTYDGGVADVLNTSAAALSGVLGGDAANLVLGTANAKGLFASANVANGIAVAGSGFGLGGSASGNYILTQPTGLSANITQKFISLLSVTKTYDGTVSATAASGATYALSGVVAADAASVSVLAANVMGTYAGADVGSGLLVNLTGVGLTGAKASNYAIAPTDTNAPIGVILPKLLTAAIINTPTKLYDATTVATLTSNNFGLVGFVSGQSAAVGQTVGVYASPDASQTDTVTASLSPGNFTAGAATNLANYILPVTASGNGVINPRPVTAAIVGPPTKPYDTTTAATLTSANYSLGGFVAGQGAQVGQTIGAYASPDASATDLVTASLTSGNFTAVGGTNFANYVLPTSASGNGVINPRPLTVSIIGTPTKVFDGLTPIALTPGNFSVTGLLGGQSVTVNQPVGAFGSPSAGPQTVTASLGLGNYILGAGALAGNYVLPTQAAGPGLITRPLTARNTLVGLLVQQGFDPNSAARLARKVILAGTLPKLYIPYPAPGDLSTWRNNGFGSIPIILDDEPGAADTDLGTESYGGESVINTPEQILLQGARRKQWRLTFPVSDQNTAKGAGQ